MPNKKMAKKQKLLCAPPCIAVYETDRCWHEKAGEPNIPVSTAYRWVKEVDRKDIRQGKEYFKIMCIRPVFHKLLTFAIF